jgi:hypothetical protein
MGADKLQQLKPCVYGLSWRTGGAGKQLVETDERICDTCKYMWFGLMTALVAFVNLASATSIIALYTPRYVYIGADSLITSLNSKESMKGCKIQRDNNFTWASAGLLFETGGTFDLRRIAAENLKPGATFIQAADGLQVVVTREFPGAVMRAKADGVKDGLRTDIVIAAFEAGRLHMSQISVDEASGTKRRDCPGTTCGEMGVFLLGQHQAVDRILDGRHAIWRELGIADAMKHLLNAQITETPEFVSGPLALVKLTSDGMTWVEGGACK